MRDLFSSSAVSAGLASLAASRTRLEVFCDSLITLLSSNCLAQLLSAGRGAPLGRRAYWCTASSFARLYLSHVGIQLTGNQYVTSQRSFLLQWRI